MPVDPELRALNIDIPAQPEALVKLSMLLAEEEVNLQQISLLVESDMALASAVLKAVNSSLYGLSGRVQSVHQAITYLGTREVAAVTFEMGLRAVFPGAAELTPVWERAAVRGLLMGRIGHAVGVDPWAAHSAGLFEECGKAVLFRHASTRYKPLLATAVNDEELTFLEHQEFGVSHDLAVVRFMADEVLVMKDGEVVEQASVAQILDAPQQDYTRRLLGAIPRGYRAAA